MFRLQDFIGHYSQALFSTDMKESVSKACATESENSILNSIFFFLKKILIPMCWWMKKELEII